jgi:uncharacterized membrane protein
MKCVLLTLTLLGVVVSSLALREHYREYGDSPCSINEHWDCGVVNHSQYATVGGVFALMGIHVFEGLFNAIPLAVAGIATYIVLGVVIFFRWYRFLLLLTFGSLAFSLFLAHIEKDILGVWCLYCVISLGIISLMCLLNLGTVVAQAVRKTAGS